MPYTQHGLVSPTPKLIKYLIALCLAFGCLSGFFTSLLGNVLNISFTNLFALSFAGLKRGFIWQPFTFMFLPETEGSLSFYFLFTLCFDLYLLWFIGCKVYRYLGRKGAIRLFFMPTICASVVVSALSHFFSFSTPIYGISYSMIPLIVGYCFSRPQSAFSFFPTQPIKVRWLGLGLLLLYLFQDIANINGTALTAHLTLFVFSYFYMVLFEKKGSPFRWTNPIDEFLLKKRKSQQDAKIVHLYETYESHENFINSTLDRIGQGQRISLFDRIRLKVYTFRKRNRI